MFCVKCGNQMPDGSKFCTKCGAPMEAAENNTASETAQAAPANEAAENQAVPETSAETPAQNVTETYQTPVAPAKGKPNILMIGGIAAAAVIFLIVTIISLSAMSKRNDPETIALNYVGYTMDGNAKKMIGCMPDKMIDTLLDELDMSKKELIDGIDEYFADNLEDMLDSLEDTYGKGKIVYESRGKSSLKKDDIEDIKEDLEDDFGIKASKVEKYKIKISYRVKGKDHKIEDAEIYMIKTGGRWYVYDQSMAYIGMLL